MTIVHIVFRLLLTNILLLDTCGLTVIVLSWKIISLLIKQYSPLSRIIQFPGKLAWSKINKLLQLFSIGFCHVLNNLVL